MLPISASIPDAKTGPIPGMDFKQRYSAGLSPKAVFSMALSIDLISASKAFKQLNEEGNGDGQGS